MLTKKKLEEFEQSGVVIVPNFLSKERVRRLKHAIDGLHGNAVYDKIDRWDMRNCLPHHTAFIELLGNKVLLGIIVQLLGFNVKLLASQIVKMNLRSKAEALPIRWHRDGGALNEELPDPLPPLFVKVGFCVSGSSKPQGGELLLIPGSHRLIGEPVFDSSTDWPFGISKILLEPGDIVIFDWRAWHAVNKNSSEVVRRMLYLTFGFRWLAPIDYQAMPEELLERSPIYGQLLGGATKIGNYLPKQKDVPLMSLFEKE